MFPFLLRGHQRPINVVKLNYDGDLLFTGDAGSLINVWQSHTGERLGSYTCKSSVKSLDVDIDSKYLIYGSFGGTFEMFQVATGKLIKWTRFPYKIKQVEFSQDSKEFLILYDEYKVNCPSTVLVFDFKEFLNQQVSNADTNQIIQSQEKSDLIKPKMSFKTTVEDGEIRLVSKVQWYVDNKLLFASTNKGQIIKYNQKGQFISNTMVHKDSQINSFVFAKDYSIIATAATDGCKIINPQTMETIRYFKQEKPMNCVSISPLFCSQKLPKYHIILGGGTPAIYTAMTRGNAGYEALVCNVMYGTEVGKISGHFGPINTIQFFRDGRGYISAGEDTVIRVVRFNEAYFDNPALQ